MPSKKKTAVILGIEHANGRKSVVFGYTADTDKPVVVLTNARKAVYWDTATKGVIGLATTGPTSGCRITAAVPRMEIRGAKDQIRMVLAPTADAVKAWEAGPWA